MWTSEVKRERVIKIIGIDEIPLPQQVCYMKIKESWEENSPTFKRFVNLGGKKKKSCQCQEVGLGRGRRNQAEECGCHHVCDHFCNCCFAQRSEHKHWWKWAENQECLWRAVPEKAGLRFQVEKDPLAQMKRRESRSVMSDSLWPHRLQCLEFSKPEYWSG